MNNLLSEYDVIIIGSGIAGLVTALRLDKNKNILVISKDKLSNNNTNLAQGGIAVTFDSNDFESHVIDTLHAGNHYNDPHILNLMVEKGGPIINALIDWGVNFDTNEKGSLLLTQEGGHSKRRIIHYKDTTGQEIIRGLLRRTQEQSNITMLENTVAIDLILKNNNAVGLEVVRDHKLHHIFAHNIVLATGGIGELYANTTNPNTSTGDGIAIAYRAGASIKDMEFVQFHPTALNLPMESHFLISEAVRGEGGILRNELGEAFMSDYHPLKDLAPRNIVSKAILEESIQQGNDSIYLDVTHLGKDYLMTRFPNIYNECFKHGIDISQEYIPIVPVQHYIMGGVETDRFGRTSINRLYACGEVACTGVHGANRMASNSLLEGAVFGNEVAIDINASVNQKSLPVVNYEDLYVTCQSMESIKNIKVELQNSMSDSVFIFRNQEDLKKAYKKIESLLKSCSTLNFSIEKHELENMLIVSKLIIESAMNRENSLGSHIIEGEK